MINFKFKESLTFGQWLYTVGGQSLPKPEVRSSNLVISKFIQNMCSKINKKKAGMARFRKQNL